MVRPRPWALTGFFGRAASPSCLPSSSPWLHGCARRSPPHRSCSHLNTASAPRRPSVRRRARPRLVGHRALHRRVTVLGSFVGARLARACPTGSSSALSRSSVGVGVYTAWRRSPEIGDHNARRDLDDVLRGRPSPPRRRRPAAQATESLRDTHRSGAPPRESWPRRRRARRPARPTGRFRLVTRRCHRANFPPVELLETCPHPGSSSDPGRHRRGRLGRARAIPQVAAAAHRAVRPGSRPVSRFALGSDDQRDCRDDLWEQVRSAAGGTLWPRPHDGVLPARRELPVAVSRRRGRRRPRRPINEWFVVERAHCGVCRGALAARDRALAGVAHPSRPVRTPAVR